MVASEIIFARVYPCEPHTPPALPPLVQSPDPKDLRIWYDSGTPVGLEHQLIVHTLAGTLRATCSAINGSIPGIVSSASNTAGIYKVIKDISKTNV
ncbi:hypothetical protein CC80DRAFT_490208 [Byssothecium circinans]|uniref:Uncharacterized protein n=1 Tax=Byssothecium circinans TaxID=147558 RepID=A0A6A5U3I5_9PLEO|nr:hypothetical protein CC80DRAFT_490208 [Byssothecium circinans]